MACRGGRHDLLGELLAHLIDGDKRMRALVDIRSNNHHGEPWWLPPSL